MSDLRSRCLPVGALLWLAVETASASEGADAGNLGARLIQPQLGTLFWTLLTFLIMLGILGRFAWRPLVGALARREAGIRGTLEQSRLDREEAGRLLEEQRALMAEARRERAEALAQGRRDAERVKAELLEEAQRQRERLLAQAETQIASSLQRARGELRLMTADLAIRAAEKLLLRNLDESTQRRLVEEHLDELERSSGAGPTLPS